VRLSLGAALLTALAALPVAVRPLSAQQSASDTSPAAATATTAGRVVAPPTPPPPPRRLDDEASRTTPEGEQATALIRKVRADPNAIPLPPTDSFALGDWTIPAGTTVPGAAAVAGGTLEVAGTVGGDAIAVNGDVIVRDGAVVRGNAFSALGRVRVEGNGRVDGEIRTLSGAVGRVARSDAAPPSTTAALKLALGWLAVLIVIGIGVLVAAGDYLDGVVVALERGFGRALLVGIASQLAIFPLLVVGVAALAITILGIVLIPFAVVAYALAVVGLFTLGFLAAASVTGRSLRRPSTRALSERGDALRALVVGIAAYLALWIAAAAFTWSPVAGGVLRGAAFALTWVATTAGFGAAILSRAGTRRAGAESAMPLQPADDVSWMTPTPVGGVVAARRPVPAASFTEPQ